MIVLVGGEKGGVGKTTVAANLAAMRARTGQDVLLLDADRQGSANLWASIREEEGVMPQVPCVQKRGKGLAANIRDLATRYSDLIIDAGGQDSVELRAALTVAHLAVFPIQPSLFDAATLETLSTLVNQAQGFNPELVAGIVINRASTNPHESIVWKQSAVVLRYGCRRHGSDLARWSQPGCGCRPVYGPAVIDQSTAVLAATRWSGTSRPAA